MKIVILLIMMVFAFVIVFVIFSVIDMSVQELNRNYCLEKNYFNEKINEEGFMTCCKNAKGLTFLSKSFNPFNECIGKLRGLK